MRATRGSPHGRGQWGQGSAGHRKQEVANEASGMGSQRAQPGQVTFSQVTVTRAWPHSGDHSRFPFSEVGEHRGKGPRCQPESLLLPPC